MTSRTGIHCYIPGGKFRESKPGSPAPAKSDTRSASSGCCTIPGETTVSSPFSSGKPSPFACYSTISSVPAPIKIHPIIDLIVNCSCRNTKARISVIITLSLSIGTTFEASPI